MSARGLVGLVGGVGVLLTSVLSHAQCSKDTDCKGDRVCEEGTCVSPPSARAPAPPAASPAPAAPERRAPAAQAEPQGPKAIGFSNLVFRLERGDVIGIAGEDFRVHILEDLRRRGLNAVGAENLVFGSDAAGTAELVLGGTVNELECAPGSSTKRVSCRMGVEWQVLDRSSDSVVYKVQTRSAALDVTKDPPIRVGRRLLIGNLGSLTARSQFQSLLVAHAAPAVGSAGYAPATIRNCALASRAMPAASEQVLDSTVVVQTATGFGSGFIASSDGFVLTAAHVVSGSAATVRLRDGRELPATVIRSDRRLDIALLRVSAPPGVTLACLPMKLEPEAVGSDAYAAGSPARRELSFSLARGIVSGIRLIDGVQYLQTDAAVNPGNSGGPLVNSSGEAVGIVSTKLVGMSVEGLAFGVPLNAGLGAIGISATADPSSPALFSAGAVTVPPAKQAVVDLADGMPALSDEGLGDDRGPTRRRSPGMMAGGIVMVSLAPVAFFASFLAASGKSSCEMDSYDYDGSGYGYASNDHCSDYDKTIYGGLLIGTVLTGVGIPLIVVGAKKVPAAPTAATARLMPWASPRGAGVGLRLDL